MPMQDPFSITDGNPDFWKNLQQFGFATMAAGAQPGATTFGALGQGGMAATQAARENALARMQTQYLGQNATSKRLENALALQGINQTNQAYGLPTMQIEGVDDLTPKMDSGAPSMPQSPRAGMAITEPQIRTEKQGGEVELKNQDGSTVQPTGQQLPYYRLNAIANGPYQPQTPQEAYAASGLARDPERKKQLIEYALGGPIAGEKAKATYKYDVGKAAAGASKTITNINSYAPFNEKLQGDMASALVENYNKMKDSSAQLKKLELAAEKVATAAPLMGSFADTKLDTIKFLNNNLGMEIAPDAVKDAEGLRSILGQYSASILKQFDAQPSQAQQFKLEAAIGGIGTDPNALPEMLSVLDETIRGSVENHNLRVADAESKGAKFMYDIKVKIPEKSDPALTTPPPMNKRIKGKLYNTPKGKMEWTGTGWLPAN